MRIRLALACYVILLAGGWLTLALASAAFVGLEDRA